MKNILTILLTSVSYFLCAQFQIVGNINGYANQDILVSKNVLNNKILLDKITTDSNGNFTYTVKNSFSGFITVFFMGTKSGFEFLTDNSDIAFQASVIENTVTIDSVTKSPITKSLFEILESEKNAEIVSALHQIQDYYYSPTDPFYKTINQEIQRLQASTPPTSTEFPLLNAYLRYKNILTSNPSTPEDITKQVSSIKDIFIYDDETLEQSTLMLPLLVTYISLSTQNATTKEDFESKLKVTIDQLLEEVNVETSRGQNVLASSISLLKQYNYKDLYNSYLKYASDLTCEINPELKEQIAIGSSIKVGEEFPTITFTKNVVNNSKMKSLQKIKSTYKLFMVWASWCGHCNNEKPAVMAFYPQFKEKGGEIIAFSLDTNKEDFTKFIEGTEWINDIDYLYWSSPLVKELGVDGTPTMYLLDENNTLLGTFSKIEAVKDFLKM